MDVLLLASDMPDSAFLCVYVLERLLQRYYPNHSVRGEFVLLMASLEISRILQYPKIDIELVQEGWHYLRSLLG